MICIHGFVLVKESNYGIPKLVVAAYDSDIHLRDLIANHPRKNVFVPEFMDKLGSRIGSVLTDSTGAFKLSKEDLHFEGVESRPDLILIVFAPEDIQDEKRPFALPPEERILYISTVPRGEAGAEEAYMIRLLQSQIDLYKIPTGAPTSPFGDRSASHEEYIKTLEQSAEDRESLRKGLTPLLKAQYKKNNDMQELARKKVKELSAIPIMLRDHPLLLKDKNDTERLQKKVATEGLTTMKKVESTINMVVTREHLREMGVNPKGNSEVTVKIDTNSLLDTIYRMTGGVDLIRKDDLQPSQVSAALLYEKYFGTGSTTTNDNNSGEKSGNAKPKQGNDKKKSGRKPSVDVK